MAKKKSKKEAPPVYLAPPKETPEYADKSLDYDPKTKVVDAFEQDLDFLLGDEAGDEVASLKKELVKLNVNGKGTNKLNSSLSNANGNSRPVLTKRIKKEILDFDISFSDDDGEDTGNPVPAPAPKITATQKTSRKKKQQQQTPAKNNIPNRAPDDPFKSSEDYFKKEFGFSDSDHSDVSDDDNELEENFKFQFVVSDEEEQIQLDEEHNKNLTSNTETTEKKKKQQKQRSSKKPNDYNGTQGQQKNSNTSKPKKLQTRKDGPKPLTRSSLLDYRKSEEEEDKKQKARGPKAHQNDTTNDESKSTEKQKRKPRRRAPTALKETISTS